MATYRVVGEAHGAWFDEGGFPTSEAAQDYASAVIDGDRDATVQIITDPDDEDMLAEYQAFMASHDDDYESMEEVR